VNGLVGFGLKGDVPFMEGFGYEEDDEPEYDSKGALFLGSVIHKYLERHRFGDPLDENLFHGTWGRLSEPNINGDHFDKETMATLRAKAMKHLETTVNDKRLIRLLEGQEHFAEVPFLFSISQGCEFRGVIDRLFKDRDRGQWVIFDWKSNDLKDKDPELVAEENDYHLQLACYKWAVEHILNEKVGDLYIYFTDRGHLLNSRWDGNPEDMIEEVLRKIGDHEANRDRWGQDFIATMKKDVSDCRFCEYEAVLCSKR